ncbi:MAG: AAA family ATPase, partial [Pseudomonadota bacterium]
MEIFDREPELAQLADALQRVSCGDGLVIALLGEAGIGKSSLVRKFVETIDREVRVLRGYCDDLGIAEPLGVLRDLAREAEIELPYDVVEPGNRLRAFSKVFEGFLDASTPTIILVEDVHWADDATVDFLRFLTRRIAGTRLMLVLTARSDGALGRNKIRRIMGDAISHDAIRLELGPLSQKTIVRLANEAGVSADQLSELTGGNAFFVTELLNSQDRSRSESVEESVLLRADRLDASLREVLDTASVFPRQVDVAHLSALLGRDLDQALVSIFDEGFLVSIDEGFEFRHVLVRQAINGAIPPTRRRAVNGQLLKMLRAEGGAPASRLLYHAREAGDDAEVKELAVKAAAEAVNIGARREARDFYGLAVEMHGPHTTPELLEEAAHACHLVGADADSIELQSRVLEIHGRHGDKKKFGNALRLRSRYNWSAGAFEASWQDAKAAVDCLLEIRGPELAMAQSNAAQVHMLNREYRLVQEPAEAAIEIAEELGRSDVLSHALNNLACALMFSDPKRAR